MTKYITADTIEKLREENMDLRESPLLVRASKEAKEFGESYSLRLVTNSKSLHPGTVQLLAEHSLGVDYLGQSDADQLHEWLLIREE